MLLNQEWMLLNRDSVGWVMPVLGISTYEYVSAYAALLFFLKNMSVIPLSMAYIAKMLGVGIKKH